MSEHEAPITLAVVVASVRDGRFGPVVAAWFADHARRRPELVVDVVDLAEAEPGSGYEAFGARIADADAVVVVTPEYNHSFPGPLKTAIDATGGAWRTTPVGFVAYGGLSGGLRAVEALRPVLAELHAIGVRDTVSFHGASAEFDTDGRPRDAGGKAGAADVVLDALVWWVRTLRRTPLPVGVAS